MNKTIKTFLGTGWGFPPTFSRINNAVQMVSADIDIEQSIRIILSTIPGERIMQPTFGCNTQHFVFEQVDTKLMNELNDVVKYALLLFEPRIKFINAELSHHNQLDGIAYIIIHYSINITNTRHNIVYPFYLNEGTNIPGNL